MSKSTRVFERWSTVMKSTWTFQVFNKYNDELNQLLWSNNGVKRTTYRNLANANLLEKASKYFDFDVPKGEEAFGTLETWSDSYVKFYNWTNLNALLAIAANLETYIATSVSLAIESDPGILFESPKSIDGILLLKNGAKRNKFHDDVVTSITKGDWNSRVSSFSKTFGSAPADLKKNIGKLDKIRNIRNKVGHAFGRDIEGSRSHEVREIMSMEKLTDKKLKDYQHIIWCTAKSIDKYLLQNHIGEYQAVAFYHRLYGSLRKDLHQSERAIILKRRIGKFGDTSGKEFCKGLVKYYEAL